MVVSLGLHSPPSAAVNKARSDLEHIYAMCLRHICRVRSNTPNSMLLTAWLVSSPGSLVATDKKLCDKLAAAPRGSFFHTVLLDNQVDAARGAKNSCGSVFQRLRSIGHPVSSDASNVSILDAPGIMQLLLDSQS